MKDPVTMRRQLVAELRRLRAGRELTQKQVADALDWSPSKIIRIEKASVGISLTDLQGLLRLYAVEDPATVDALTEMSRGSKRLPFNEYRTDLPPETLRYFRYESSTTVLRQVEPLIVPGLLQTEEYARALLRELGKSPETVERLWSARAERQELLDREEPLPPEMFFIVGEAVVRQVVGNEGVLRRQRERLSELNARPRISIQVLAFADQANIAMQGPFTYLAFEDTEDPDVLYAEGTLGDSVIRDDEELTTSYLDHFLKLEKEIALKATDLDNFLSQL